LFGLGVAADPADSVESALQDSLQWLKLVVPQTEVVKSRIAMVEEAIEMNKQKLLSEKGTA
jgi:hypothetical protein